MSKVLTVCLVHEHPRLLLGLKKRGFGEGRWNGFGGKVQAGETIEEGAKRELMEEAGIEASDLEKVGLIEFEFDGNPEIMEVHFFRVNGYSGEPAESEEMRPQWFDVNEIPFDEMWPDDRYWIPLFLQNKKFKGKIFFKDQNTIVNTDLIEVDNL